MLTDTERVQLRRIEQRLLQDDADFVRGLRQGTSLLPPASSPPADLRPLRGAACYAAVTLVLLLLAGGSAGGALGMCVLMLAGQRCWACPRAAQRQRRLRRRRRRRRRP